MALLSACRVHRLLGHAEAVVLELDAVLGQGEGTDDRQHLSAAFVLFKNICGFLGMAHKQQLLVIW